MAIAKRRKATAGIAKRKSGAKKRKTKSAESASTLTLFGRRYKKSMCGLTKADATAKANAHRARGKGKGAAVKKSVNGYCLYKRG